MSLIVTKQKTEVKQVLVPKEISFIQVPHDLKE